MAVNKCIHGYDLASRIGEAGGSITVSTMYRTLDRLEERSLFTSSLEPSIGRGPAKRVYEPTSHGITTAAVIGTDPGTTAAVNPAT